MSNTIMQSLTVIAFIFWVNPNVNNFDKPRHLTEENVNWIIISLEYTPELHKLYFASSFQRMLQPYNVWTTEDKNPKHAMCTLYFWHTCDLETKSRSPKLRTKMLTPSKLIIMQSLKDCAFTVSERKKKATIFFQTRKFVSYLPWTCVEPGWGLGIVAYSWSNWRNQRTQFQLKG